MKKSTLGLVGALGREQGAQSVLGWIGRNVSSAEPAMVAVDAPTIISNDSSCRDAERQINKAFWSYDASAHSSNLKKPFARETTSLGRSLEKLGFKHAASIEARKVGRYQIEVFPHPAIVNLFDLQRILKFKKGLLAIRALELNRLREYILRVLPTLEPGLAIASLTETIPVIPSQGKAMKAVEDQLEALICAYMAAYWWFWDLERNSVFGKLETGYIVVPNRIQGRQAAFATTPAS